MQRICTSGSDKNTCGRGYRWIPYRVSFVKRGTTPLVNASEGFFFRDSGVWGSHEHEHLRTGGMHEARGGNEGEPRLKGTACSWEGTRTCGLACTLPVPGAHVHPLTLGPSAHTRVSGIPGQRVGLGIRLGHIPAWHLVSQNRCCPLPGP